MNEIIRVTITFSCILAVLISAVLTAPSLSLYESDVTEPRDVDDTNEGDQRIREEDLRKLILKKMRFRDLEGIEDPQVYTPYHQDMKRADDFNLAHKVAEFLHGLKVRQVKSPKVRMPSLRFGK